MLGGAVAAVWFLILQPVVQPERSADKTRTAAPAKPATSLGTRLKSLSTGGFTPGLATSTGLPGLARLQVAVVDASGAAQGRPATRAATCTSSGCTRCRSTPPTTG